MGILDFLQYNRALDVGEVTLDNGDGTYNVKINGRDYSYDGLSPQDGRRYQEGDSVMVGSIGGDRNNVCIMTNSSFK